MPESDYANNGNLRMRCEHMAQVKIIRHVCTNDRGLRIGEGHPKSDLTDHEVDLVRQLHEEDNMSYSTLSEKFEQSKGAIAKICRYERRAQTVAKFKKIVEVIETD